MTVTSQLPILKIKTVTINYTHTAAGLPAKTISIKKGAFVGCTSLERVVFPAGKYEFVKGNERIETIFFSDDVASEIVEYLRDVHSDYDFFVYINK